MAKKITVQFEIGDYVKLRDADNDVGPHMVVIEVHEGMVELFWHSDSATAETAYLPGEILELVDDD